MTWFLAVALAFDAPAAQHGSSLCRLVGQGGPERMGGAA